MGLTSSFLNDNINATVLSNLLKELHPIALPAALEITKYAAVGAVGLVVLGNAAGISLGAASIVCGFGKTFLGNRITGHKLTMEGAECIELIFKNKGSTLIAVAGFSAIALTSHVAQTYLAGI